MCPDDPYGTPSSGQLPMPLYTKQVSNFKGIRNMQLLLNGSMTYSLTCHVAAAWKSHVCRYLPLPVHSIAHSIHSLFRKFRRKVCPIMT